jgi:ankyrin repeat protein
MFILTHNSQALHHQNIPLIEYLLLHGADVNMVAMQKSRQHRYYKTPYGSSLATRPLDTAASCCSPEIIKALIANGAQLSKSNALHRAATSKSPDRIPVLQFLLDQGMDVNALEYLDAEYGIAPGNRNFGTPLHYAVRQARVSVVKFLLEHGADPEKHCSLDPETPLDWINGSHEDISAELAALLAQKKS